MIRIGILGAIGSGKSYIAKNFGHPVFNADQEVARLYKKDKKVFLKLKKTLPRYINSFPVNKNDIGKAILANKTNLKKIIKVIHLEVRKKMNIFIKKNKNKRIIILDIPLLLENKLNKANDILIFVEAKKNEISKRLNKRINFNKALLKKFKDLQLSLDYKRKKSHFIINNNITKKTIKRSIKKILKEI